MTINLASQEFVSYELFQEVAGEMCEPIDPELTSQVRYELYCSKIIYLRHVYNEAIRDINSNVESLFSTSDLVRIQQSLAVTDEFMRSTILELLNNVFSSITTKHNVA